MFNTILYQPLLNSLIFLHKVIPGHDIGIAIIILTIVIRFILYLPSLSSIKAQKSLQDLQPKIDEIKRKYKDNREEQGRQLMRAYKENKVNPLSSCLPLLIQLPIIYALFRVFYGGLNTDPTTGILVSDQLNHLYGSLRETYLTTPVSSMFLGFIDLAKKGNYVLAILAGAFQYWQSKMLMAKKPPLKVPGAKDENMASIMTKQMTYIMPIVTVFFGYSLPAGVTLYWLVTTIFSVVQQYIYYKKHPIKTS
jgi:YidC/Oxa1 family membrane protein insertase